MAEISDVQPSAAGGRELSKGVILKPGDSLKVYYVRYEIALGLYLNRGCLTSTKGPVYGPNQSRQGSRSLEQPVNSHASHPTMYGKALKSNVEGLWKFSPGSHNSTRRMPGISSR